MPTYAYRCKDCNHQYEVFQSIKQNPHETCPECNGSVIRLIGAGAGILFKGPGFYSTDYRKGSEKKSATVAENQKQEKGKPSEVSSGDSNKDSSTKKTPEKANTTVAS